MIDVPAARPSTPSVRFTPFAAPAMMRKSSTYQRRPERDRPVDDRDEDAVVELLVVRREADRDGDPARAAASSSGRASPSERWWRSLMKSSRNPIAPQASVVPKIVSAGSV